MQKGFNSDVAVKGKGYHIQTEDWGVGNPYIVTRVYASGAVLKTVKSAYEDVLRGGPVNDAAAIQQAMRRQHHRVMDELISGTLL
ncbi:MAG: hypothetical protein BroJett040_25870 [Oligoflexia bacterium]|nr:MAG: hypothetical protein BroJett040_25870 [Oligoflexia bacterium]